MAMSEAGWHGKHLTEDEIVADMLAKIKADPDALESWTNWEPAPTRSSSRSIPTFRP